MNASRATFVVVAITGVVAVGAAVALPLNSPVGLADGDSPETLAMFAAVGLLWLAAILVTLARQPTNPLWLLMLAYVVANRLIWSLQFVPQGVVQGLALSVATSVPILLYMHVLVAYPSGHLQTRFDRLLVATVYVVALGINLASRATWYPDADCPTAWCPENVLLVWPDNNLSENLSRALQLASPIIGALVVFAVWRHWRTAAPAARRVLLPVAVVVPLAYISVSLRYLAQAFENEAVISALHYPSYLIDAIVPLGLLLGVLRMRLNRGRVAGLVVELARGVPAGGLRDVLARALGDPTLQLAFATADAAGYVDGTGHVVELPADEPGRAVARIERNGEALAVLVHDPVIDAEDPGLVEAVSGAARMAIENEQLTAQVRAQLEEVRASRLRIVEAADEERRKVERDLHDGAQQRLVALAMRLEQSRETTEGSSRMIDDATAELREAIAEVRGLARGLHPPILTEAGLGAAVESLAERAAVPVDIRIPDARFPPAVEVTAYFVVAEALTNVTRHAGATVARVDAGIVGDELTVTIMDDGRGGADPGRGTGLRGLRDRVVAIDGTLDVASSPGQGTTVRVTLPLAANR